jgi:hypothetical protein
MSLCRVVVRILRQFLRLQRSLHLDYVAPTLPYIPPSSLLASTLQILRFYTYGDLPLAPHLRMIDEYISQYTSLPSTAEVGTSLSLSRMICCQSRQILLLHLRLTSSLVFLCLFCLFMYSGDEQRYTEPQRYFLSLSVFMSPCVWISLSMQDTDHRPRRRHRSLSLPFSLSLPLLIVYSFCIPVGDPDRQNTFTAAFLLRRMVHLHCPCILLHIRTDLTYTRAGTTLSRGRSSLRTC